ncbi:hypothetical protein ES319_A07G205600v1 [Gossypium barbadense]|uniref:Uncharacterized protein n=2 Tax=Gossypium TaxID=3633 RepID=A0A5J5V676_GOSBA|nr:hypothetical protein ES319_A07G205600v1 [Gossypium barbadense]TYH11000.1 hypothetical protein ES288_A07G223300v1 [Gossypium darwinii]
MNENPKGFLRLSRRRKSSVTVMHERSGVRRIR